MLDTQEVGIEHGWTGAGFCDRAAYTIDKAEWTSNEQLTVLVLSLKGVEAPLYVREAAAKSLVALMDLPPEDWPGEEVEVRLRKRGIVHLRPIPLGKAPIGATRYRWQEPGDIKPRQWLYGRHLIRKFVSCTVAAPGVGKSSLAVAEMLSIVTGRALLIDQAPERGRAWWWNGEDPLEELTRRVQAACLHYGIGWQDIEGRLFVDSGREQPIVVGQRTDAGTVVNAPDVDGIKATIRQHRIDAMIVDPFIASHTVAESDNSSIEAVAWEWAKIADECNCAVELIHHVRKTAGAAATVEDSRGAGALLAKARSARVLNTMTPEEAKRAGVDNAASISRPTTERPAWRRRPRWPNGSSSRVLGWGMRQRREPQRNGTQASRRGLGTWWA